MALTEGNPPIREQRIKVGAIMSTNLLQCSPATPIGDAARLMADARKSSIIITRDGAALGIWTEHDALRHDLTTAAARRRAIGEIMSSPVKTVHVDDDISDIAQRLKSEGLRHYVVVDDRALAVGLISQSDIVLNHGVEWFMRLHTVQSILHRPALTCPPETTMARIAARMYQEQTDCAVMQDRAGTWGIITERDIVRHIASDGKDRRADEVASWPLATVASAHSLFHARNLMVAREFRHLGVTDEGGQLIGVVGFREILSTIERSYMEELQSALAERDSALRASEERYRMLVELSPDAILVVAADRILFANPASLRLLGVSGFAELHQRGLLGFLDTSATHPPPEERLQLIEAAAEQGHHGYWEERLRRADGRPIDVELLASAVSYNDQPAYQIVMRDITERKMMEEGLRKMARTDPMTGAANRMEFELRCGQAIGAAQRYGNHFSVVMLDIDHFKRFNDDYGHKTGDTVLCRLAQTIQAELREVDLFARWGGEEFMVLLPETTLDEAAVVARKIRDSVRLIDLGIAAGITVSLSAASYERGEDLQHLLHRLDVALYEAKHAGRNQFILADPTPARTLR